MIKIIAKNLFPISECGKANPKMHKEIQEAYEKLKSAISLYNK